MAPPHPFPPPPTGPNRVGANVVSCGLWVLAVGCGVVALLGLLYALAAGSASNRAGNQWAELGVGLGWLVAAVSGGLAVLLGLIAAASGRRRPR